VREIGDDENRRHVVSRNGGRTDRVSQ